LTGVELIVAASAVGAAAGNTETTGGAIKDTDAALRDGVRRRLAQLRAGEAFQVLEARETDPGVS